MPYIIRQKLDYDEEIELYGEQLDYYSPKQMKELYPDKGSYTIVGEIRQNNKKEAIEKVKIGEKYRKVAAYKDFSRILNKEVGYLCVGDDEYIVILKSRLAFLLMLFGLGFGILAVGLLLWFLLKPEVVTPINPLPPIDTGIQTLPGDGSTPAPADPNGGGTVSMIYSLDAELSLSTGEISMYFQNPNASNHDVVLELYIISGEQQVLVAVSGRLPTGAGLYKMQFDETAAKLMEGIYEGKFTVHYYNPVTGEKALVESDITDVTITVKP